VKSRRYIAVGLGSVLLGLAVCVLLPPAMPSIRGQTLVYWLDHYLPKTTVGGYVIVSVDPQAQTAIRELGTNGIPSLLRMAEAHDPPIKLKLVALVRRQNFVRFSFTSSGLDHERAVIGFSALGPAASNAVAHLVNILTTRPPACRDVAAKALGTIGPAAASALPALCSGLSSTNGSLRRECALALGQIHAEPARSIPALIKTLDDPGLRWAGIEAIGKFGAAAKPAVPALTQICDGGGREASSAATALGMIGPDASQAVPSLVRGLANADLDMEFRLQCILALGRIHSLPELVVPALVQSINETLNDTDVRIRASSATALGRFGPDARQATSLLTTLLQDSNRNVRLAATNAWHLIDAGTDSSDVGRILRN
jgi:HEAT repeat protein